MRGRTNIRLPEKRDLAFAFPILRGIFYDHGQENAVFGSAGHDLARLPRRQLRKDRGALGGTRTHDPLLRRQLLYPLSYQGGLFNCTEQPQSLNRSSCQSLNKWVGYPLFSVRTLTSGGQKSRDGGPVVPIPRLT